MANSVIKQSTSMYVEAASVDGTNFKKNLLLISLSDRFALQNKNAYFFINPSNPLSNFSNVPTKIQRICASSNFLGFREVFWYTDNHIMIKITELFPEKGREYINFYNNSTWEGWKVNEQRDGLLQSFKTVSSINDFISLAMQVPYYPIIIGGSDAVLNSLTGQQGSGFVIAKYVENTDVTTSRIDYIAYVGGTGLIGSVFQGSINTYTSTVKYNKISNMVYGSYNSTLYGYGWITTSTKELDIFCPLSFRGTSINITKCTIAMRHSDGGYVGTSGQDVTSMITSATLQQQQQLLRLVITNSNGWGLTNNIPIAGYVQITGTIS